MSLSTKEKKDWAQLLFVKHNVSQKEIAERVGATEKTVSKWVNDGNWKIHRASIIITREEELRRFYMMLNEQNEIIQLREKKVPTNSEADIISKLTASIKNLEKDSSIADIISVFTDFTEFLKEYNFDKAKEFIQYLDAFIKHKLSKH